jgi:hemoglobin
MTVARTDLESRADIERLVNGFYALVDADEVLGPIFKDVDWDEHLPRMYAFWESVMFGASSFQGDPLAVHLALARNVSIGPHEFRRWLDLFRTTVDNNFSGPRADDVKARAGRIAEVMLHHLRSSG